MLKVILLILLAEIWNTAGQIFFKKSTNALEVRSLRGVSTHIKLFRDILTNPLAWLGFGSMAMGLVIWFIALAGADLSVVSPIGSMQYILILITAHYFLGEKINALKLIGTLLVVAGIVLVAMS
jgi:drug/metabolite transporter (DMT)-like permease